MSKDQTKFHKPVYILSIFVSLLKPVGFNKWLMLTSLSNRPFSWMMFDEDFTFLQV